MLVLPEGEKGFKDMFTHLDTIVQYMNLTDVGMDGRTAWHGRGRGYGQHCMAITTVCSRDHRTADLNINK